MGAVYYVNNNKYDVPVPTAGGSSIVVPTTFYVVDNTGTGVYDTFPFLTKTSSSGVTVANTAYTYNNILYAQVDRLTGTIPESQDPTVLLTSGYSGISGYSGPGAASGYSGKSGYSGTNGTNGTSGYSGTDGASGYSGVGTSGYSGYSGVKGVNGVTLLAGLSGIVGVSGGSSYVGASGYSGPSQISVRKVGQVLYFDLS